MYGLLGISSFKNGNVHLSRKPLYSHLWDNRLNRTFSVLFKQNRNFDKNMRNKHPLVINYTMSDYYTENHAIKPNDDKRKTKNKKSKLVTTITQVTPSSAKQIKAPVQLFRAKELSLFLKHTFPNTQQKLKTDAIAANNLNEEPVVLVPVNFNANQQLIEIIFKSYVNFMKKYDENQQIANQNAVPLTDPHVNFNEPRPSTEVVTVEKSPANADEATVPQYTNRENSRHDSLVKSLKAYLNACVFNEMENRGLSVLLSYRNRNKEAVDKVNLKDVELYTILMSGYARRGNFKKVSRICSILNEDNITFTPQVYATIFECLGRMGESSETLEQLRYFERHARQNKISPNDIMDKSMFVYDQREVVLDTIRKILPQFQPTYTAPKITYTNPLLLNLNDNVRPVEENLNRTGEPSDGSKIFNSKKGFASADLKSLFKEQMKSEMTSCIEIKSIFKRKNGRPHVEVERYRQLLNDLFKKWHTEICAAFKRDLAAAQHNMNSKNSNRLSIYPYLRLLKPEQFADLLIAELKSLGESNLTYSPTSSQMAANLGRKVQLQYQNQLKIRHGLTQKMENLYNEYCDGISLGSNSDNPRQLWQRIVYHQISKGSSWNVPDISWPWPVLSDIGGFLFKILLHDIKIDTNIFQQNKKCSPNNSDSKKCSSYMPIVYSLFRNRDLKAREEVTPNPLFVKLYEMSEPETLTFDANLVPMVCPPIPWTSPHSGGYLVMRSDLLRLPDQAVQQLERIKEMPEANLYPALDALNQLGSIPWRVNTRILDIVIEVFNKGGSDKLHVPKVPDTLLPNAGKPNAAHQDQVIECLFSEPSWKKPEEQAGLYSLWCDTLYKLSLANHFRDKPFWLPHNMDFRGRVYPVPPHLNHLSSDLSRSLLFFSQKQPLGKDGLMWLKLHCVNLTGKKKRDSVHDRLVYAEKVMEDILDSADNPLTGKMWWLDSDEPWQTLASCMEIAKASRSANPEEYMSQFPIHQDGSCNGLQHYAALGRDLGGAISVNLAPSEKPQDVYSTVANLVETLRQHDADNGNEIARALEGRIKRKIIKQTVMTTVYGVTPYGARLQIEKQLKNLDDFPQELVKNASYYLTGKTFASLGTMFKSAQQIQDWFTKCARHITKKCGLHVEWITPLDLPVVQPYAHYPKMSGKSVSNVEQTSEDKYALLNTRKEKNAFPPNFIHSLDSCHMMLTSLNCERAGLTFVSVHDCFWTHACTVPTMSRICRDQFVLLHSQPILEDLSSFFYNKFEIEYGQTCSSLLKPKAKRKNVNELKECKDILRDIPEKGTFDLNEVLKSVYFFS